MILSYKIIVALASIYSSIYTQDGKKERISVIIGARKSSDMKPTQSIFCTHNWQKDKIVN